MHRPFLIAIHYSQKASGPVTKCPSETVGGCTSTYIRRRTVSKAMLESGLPPPGQERRNRLSWPPRASSWSPGSLNCLTRSSTSKNPGQIRIKSSPIPSLTRKQISVWRDSIRRLYDHLSPSLHAFWHPLWNHNRTVPLNCHC